MDITVAVVTYNAGAYIRGCLESILALEPHGGEKEILVVDGLSEDDTREIVKSFGDRVRLIENPGRTIASNRNAALGEAKYPFLAFTDADCLVPPDWLKVLAPAMEDLAGRGLNVGAVGGGNTNLEKANTYQRALGLALNSYIGSLGSPQGKIYDRAHEVPSLSCLNVMYSRAALEALDGFDEALGNMGEDPDMNFRLRQAGYLIYYIPGANVQHAARPNLKAWASNMYRYGLGRANLMHKHKTLFGAPYIGALLFVPFFIACTVMGLFWPWAWAGWLYFPLLALFGFALAFKGGEPGLGTRVAAILVATHLSYAAGLFKGAVHPPLKAAPKAQGA